jgi:toxin ParE1/3/4
MTAAIDWYDLQSPGLGNEFEDAVSHSLHAIGTNPHQYQIVRGEIRRAPLGRRFPYFILYGITDDEVVVLRCVHGSRDPRKWPDRM